MICLFLSLLFACTASLATYRYSMENHTTKITIFSLNRYGKPYRQLTKDNLTVWKTIPMTVWKTIPEV